MRPSMSQVHGNASQQSRHARRRDDTTSSSLTDGFTITDSQLEHTLSALSNIINDRRRPQASTDGNSLGNTAPDGGERPTKRL